MAAEVVPLQRVKLPSGPGAITPDQKYWRGFSSQQLIPTPHSAAITHISFPGLSSRLSTSTSTSSSPETFAVTSGSRVQIFSTRTCKLLKTITRFGIDDGAHSGEIRNRDGRVLVAGGDSGAIQVFDTNSRAILKTWKEHRQPTWVTKWHPTTLTSLMSASDDRTVRLWDLTSSESVTTFAGHQDYVRCGAWMPGQGAGLLVSGSYDQTVRVWDPRAPGRAVMCFKHAAAVESVLPLQSGTTLLAAAGSQVAVLDLVAARPAQLLRNHQKTVTALALAAKGSRVVSGALDGHVKVFETTGWAVVAGFKYSAPVLALSVVTSGPAQEDRLLAVGLENGLLSVRTRLSGQQKVLARERQKEMQALVEGKIEEYDKKKAKRRGKGWERRLRGKDYTGEEADIVIEGNQRGKMKSQTPWERALRRGQYEAALDLVLSAKPYSRQDVLTLLAALVHRSALRTALSGRNEQTLRPIIRFLINSVNDPRLARLVEDTATLVLDLYGEHMGQSSDVDGLVTTLHEGVRKNAEVAQMAWASTGMLDLLMAEG